MMEYAWTREIEDIAREFNVDLHTGLTKRQVRLSLQKYGKNGKDSRKFHCFELGREPPCSLPVSSVELFY
jgi:hypothetical protein